MKEKKLILGSKSPRRQQLIGKLGYPFEVVTYEVDESFSNQLQKGAVASYLAEKKALAFPHELKDNILLTADTIVCLGERVINKPLDLEEARQMLQDLSGQMHEVFTGVCLRSTSQQSTFFERTEVYFKTLSDWEINSYIEQYQPLDKAGAYGIQEWIGYIGVEKIVGCYNNVIGLPLSRVYRELEQF